MFEFFIKYFLVFPKIQLGGDDSYSGFGILVGEAILVLYGITLFKRKMPLSTILILLLTFLCYLILFSSLLNAPIAGIFPTMSVFYFLRILLYVGIFVFFYSSSNSNDQFVAKNFFVKPFRIQFYLSLIIVIIYHVLYKPSLNEIMWNYNTGLRMIPFAGMTFNKDSFFFLQPIGGGSGNLLCSWALGVLIIADCFKLKETRQLIIIVLITGLLTFSRGGLLTLLIYVFYMVFRRRHLDKRIFLGVILFSVLILVVLVTSDELTNSLFSRLKGTFQAGQLDSSSMGRIKNYSTMLSLWGSNPFFVLFGMGYDEAILRSYTGYSIVESFFLQVLISGGVIAFVMLMTFYYTLYSMSKINNWFLALWKFVLFESFIQWTITGGDFLSPHVMFLIMAMMGLGYKKLNEPQKLALESGN